MAAENFKKAEEIFHNAIEIADPQSDPVAQLQGYIHNKHKV